MQLQTTARCKGPPDGAGYRPPETRQQVTQPGRPDAQGPPPAGWPGRGLGARPQYAIRGRGNKFVQLQAINRYGSVLIEPALAQAGSSVTMLRRCSSLLLPVTILLIW